MALPVARTRDEAHLFMDLRPCEACGKTDVRWETSLTSDDGAPARRYAGPCQGCERPREFVFRLPGRPLLPGPADIVLFGGDEPSDLLDAGDWLHVADVCAEAAGAPDPALTPEARESLIVAIAALDEVLKFIPDDRDEVPRGGFWSDRGRTLRRTASNRFARTDLLATRTGYEQALGLERI